MRNGKTNVADSLVSIGLLSRANSLLYVHSLPEKLTRRMEGRLGGLDVVAVKSLRGKREVGCTSKR